MKSNVPLCFAEKSKELMSVFLFNFYFSEKKVYSFFAYNAFENKQRDLVYHRIC